ncbi:MAG: HAMP domain-containing protein [Phycisphaeraceae bacterium]|nr:HAMP domain-containing protein [Phycisphaeraceae bacterium]
MIREMTSIIHSGRRRLIGRMRNMAIRHKLVSIIMLTCIVALVVAGSTFMHYQHLSTRKNLVKTLQTQAAMIATTCQAAITFDDAEDAEDILNAFQEQSSVVFACLSEAEGQILASYHRDDGIAPQEMAQIALEETHLFTRDYLMVSKPVMDRSNREILGFLSVWSDLTPIEAMFRRYMIAISMVIIMASLVAYLVSSKVQSIISDPILKLTHVVKTVSDQKEYSVRARKENDDELGVLIDAFNHMLMQIQARDMELVCSNERLEARVEKRTRELEMTVAELKRSNSELQNFTYITAHDLKAPLRAIGNLTDWISADYIHTFDDRGREHMELIKSRVSRMDELIDCILRYNEIGRGRRHIRTFDLNCLLSEALTAINPPEHITIEITSDLPTLTVERHRILQIFRNLIGNAIQFINRDQGRIRIACQDNGDTWEFSVSDNGPGIGTQYHEKIFKMFQTLTPRDELESTGIGLAVVKKIVELYGGKIWVASELGQGSTFHFTLSKALTCASQEDQEGCTEPVEKANLG